MTEDMIFKGEDIDKYLKPLGFARTLFELYGIIRLSKEMEGKK